MTTRHWAYDALFYHIYPLGFCGAPPHNDFSGAVVPRLERLYSWIDHLVELGVNALYLGPLFESSTHGYDTADYNLVDRRLGSNETLSNLAATLHRRGLRLILDGVFHHVGRDFWAFRDLQQHGRESAYRDWFAGLCFERRSPYGDPFGYEGWNGHYELVKLNLQHPHVRAHLFQAVGHWIDQFGIDGLRLDVADCIDVDFLQELSTFCRHLRTDFWLLGEVIHGDYCRWANAETLGSVTNYECYKGLYSSLRERNYFEIAYALERQFGPQGLYRHLPLYNFVDNHDVNRVASNLDHPAHLYPLYCLLFTMPGVPSIYYGSEWGLEGRRSNGDDRPLRPCLDLPALAQASPQPALVPAIQRLARLRQRLPALRYGDYVPLAVSHEQLAFSRLTDKECVVVLLNASERPAAVQLPAPRPGRSLVDLLNPGQACPLVGGSAQIDVWPHWARVMVVE